MLAVEVAWKPPWPNSTTAARTASARRCSAFMATSRSRCRMWVLRPWTCRAGPDCVEGGAPGRGGSMVDAGRSARCADEHLRLVLFVDLRRDQAQRAGVQVLLAQHEERDQRGGQRDRRAEPHGVVEARDEGVAHGGEHRG